MISQGCRLTVPGPFGFSRWASSYLPAVGVLFPSWYAWLRPPWSTFLPVVATLVSFLVWMPLLILALFPPRGGCPLSFPLCGRLYRSWSLSFLPAVGTQCPFPLHGCPCPSWSTFHPSVGVLYPPGVMPRFSVWDPVSFETVW